MRYDSLDLYHQRVFIVITSGCEKIKEEGFIQREKTLGEICLPDSRTCECALQQ